MTMPPGERLIVVVGPSGAGKDTLLRHWQALLRASGHADTVGFVRRLITRPAEPRRDGATPDGVEAHEPVSVAQLQVLREQHALAFEWQANGLHYAVRRASLAALEQGRWRVLNGSRAHLRQMQAICPGLRVVLIDAPEALRAERLASRAREDAADVQRRLTRQPDMPPPDLRLCNDGAPERAAAELHAWWRSLAGV